MNMKCTRPAYKYRSFKFLSCCTAPKCSFGTFEPEAISRDMKHPITTKIGKPGPFYDSGDRSVADGRGQGRGRKDRNFCGRAFNLELPIRKGGCLAMNEPEFHTAPLLLRLFGPFDV